MLCCKRDEVLRMAYNWYMRLKDKLKPYCEYMDSEAYLGMVEYTNLYNFQQQCRRHNIRMLRK